MIGSSGESPNSTDAYVFTVSLQTRRANVNNWNRKKFINEDVLVMIGIPKEASPVQVCRILKEAYAREHHFTPSETRSFVIPTLNKLRRSAVSKPPTQKSTNDEDEVEVQPVRIANSINTRNRRLDSHELENIPVTLPQRRVRSQSCASLNDLDMDELTSVVSGKSRSSSMIGGLHFPVDTPDTASSMVGWVVCPEVYQTKWRKPKVTDAIVRYAEKYYEQNRINPFKSLKS